MVSKSTQPRGKLIHHLHDLDFFLAKTYHQTGFGEDRRVDFLDAVEQFQRCGHHCVPLRIVG